MIPPKRFDIFPPDWGMLRRSRRVLLKKGYGFKQNRVYVEGTTYNHGRPEGISERLAFYAPVSRYATGMSALRTHIHGIIPRGSSLPTSPDPAP